MRKSEGLCWLPVIALFFSGGCQEKASPSLTPPPPSEAKTQSPLANTPSTPSVPTVAEARLLLADLDKLEHRFGLALIAATPPRTGGQPFSVSGAETRIQEAKQEIEFLNAAEPIAKGLTSTKFSLEAFVNSPNEKNWRDVWQKLTIMYSGFVELTGGSIWHDEVPSNESQGVVNDLTVIKTSMERLAMDK